MQTISTKIALSLALVLGGASVARADFITTNMSINTPLSDPFTVIGYGSYADLQNRVNPSSPVVNFGSEGDVAGVLSVYNNSMVTITADSIGGTLFAKDSSYVLATESQIGNNVNASGASSVTLFNVSVAGYLNASGRATLNFGGSAGQVAYDVHASGTSTVSLSDVSVGGNLVASNNATLFVSGGLVGGGLVGSQNSTIFLSGGLFGGLSDGDLYSGSGNSVLNIFGSGLTLTPGGSTGVYELSGTLQDGNSVDGQITLGAGAQVNLYDVSTPEPSSLSLLALGAACMGGAAWRRRQQLA